MENSISSFYLKNDCKFKEVAMAQDQSLNCTEERRMTYECSKLHNNFPV